MTDLDALPEILRLHPAGEHLYEGEPEHGGDHRNVVFGGQILAQMILAAHLDRNADRVDAKEVKSIHTIFARAGDYTQPIQYDVERMHDGRTLGSDTVTFSQNGKIMSRGLILWSADEPDLIRHVEAVEMPDVPGPEEISNSYSGLVFPGAEARIVDDIDVWSAEQPVGPALQNVWTRFDSTYSPVVNQAILSWATDGWLIGTSMLPHAEVHQTMAHRTISTGVVSHSLNFHDRFDADEWLLLANESIWAGRGRTYGRCNIWTATVASSATTRRTTWSVASPTTRITPATTTGSCRAGGRLHGRPLATGGRSGQRLPVGLSTLGEGHRTLGGVRVLLLPPEKVLTDVDRLLVLHTRHVPEHLQLARHGRRRVESDDVRELECPRKGVARSHHLLDQAQSLGPDRVELDLASHQASCRELPRGPP